MGEGEWEIYQTDEVAAWMRDLGRTDPQAAEKVEAAVDVLAEYGPTLGRPLVDTLAGSTLANLKELRPLFALYLKERAKAEEEGRE